MDVITQEIRALRARNGISQAEMAKKLHVTYQTYQRWESNPKKVPIEKLNSIFGVFGTTFEDVFFKHELDETSNN